MKNHTKTGIIVLVATLLVAGLTYFSYQSYHHYKQNIAAKNAAAAVVNQTQEIAAAQKKAVFDAQIKNLIAICTQSQQRYDTLAKADQAKSVRPDCTISQE